MDKFTDDVFGFPIKIYDGFSLRKAMEQEEKEEISEPVPADWVMGYVRIPGRGLERLIWHDGFSRERSVKEVAESGFDLTIIVSDVYGDFACTWPRRKFEEKLNEFMEKHKERNRNSNPFINAEFVPLGSFVLPGPEEPKEPKE